MSKGMGLLPSWYWPEGVQRYLSAPQVALYELAVGRWARRYGSSPALVGPDYALTFAELDQETGRTAASCVERAGSGEPRVAIAVRSPRAFALVFLGALRAGGSVLLLDPRSAREDQAAALRLFQAQLLVTDAPAGLGQEAGLPELAPEALLEAAAPAAPAPMADAARPSIGLAQEGGIVYHNHISVMSAAMAFAAFTLLQPEDRYLVARPPGSWEGLLGLLAPLQAGGAAVLPASDDPEAAAAALSAAEALLLWIDEATALAILDGGGPLMEAARGRCQLVYVSVRRPLPRRLRRHLHRLLGAHILTIYGYPATSAIAAAHPSWYLEDAIGIPMTGVDLVPVDPDSLRAVEAPWELLTHAGIGVRARALAVETAGSVPGPGFIEEGLWYTGDIGSVDANGMLYLLT